MSSRIVACQHTEVHGCQFNVVTDVLVSFTSVTQSCSVSYNSQLAKNVLLQQSDLIVTLRHVVFNFSGAAVVPGPFGYAANLQVI